MKDGKAVPNSHPFPSLLAVAQQGLNLSPEQQNRGLGWSPRSQDGIKSVNGLQGNRQGDGKPHLQRGSVLPSLPFGKRSQNVYSQYKGKNMLQSFSAPLLRDLPLTWCWQDSPLLPSTHIIWHLKHRRKPLSCPPLSKAWIILLPCPERHRCNDCFSLKLQGNRGQSFTTTAHLQLES